MFVPLLFSDYFTENVDCLARYMTANFGPAIIMLAPIGYPAWRAESAKREAGPCCAIQRKNYR